MTWAGDSEASSQRSRRIAAERKEDDSRGGEGCGCTGCLSFVLLLLAVWALAFGVTVNGKHYGMKGCSCDKGVEFDK